MWGRSYKELNKLQLKALKGHNDVGKTVTLFSLLSDVLFAGSNMLHYSTYTKCLNTSFLYYTDFNMIYSCKEPSC